MLNLILFVPDEGLEENYFLLIGWILNVLGHLYSLIIIPIFIVALGKIEFVFGDFRVVFGKLFVDSSRVEEILAHIIAIGQK